MTVAKALWRAVPWLLLGILVLVLLRQVYPRVDLQNELGPAPDFALLDLHGEPFRLSDLAGQVVVVNFWATWCPPCRAEIPGFIALQDELRDRGVVFVGISLDDDGAEAVAPYVGRRGVNYPILLDGHSAAQAFGGVGVLPTTILIDRHGQVRYRHEGFLLPRALRPAIRGLLREA